MSLGSKFELPFHAIEVLLVFLDAFFFVLISIFAGFLWWFDLLEKIVMMNEKLLARASTAALPPALPPLTRLDALLGFSQ